MPGDLAVPTALHYLPHHWTLLLHRQHLLLHLLGLPRRVLPQPAPGIPLLEETPHLQGALRGSASSALGRLGSIHGPLQLPAPTCCKLGPVEQREEVLFLESLWLFSESPRMVASCLCRGGAASSSAPYGHRLTTSALSVLGGSPRPPSDLHIPFVGASR